MSLRASNAEKANILSKRSQLSLTSEEKDILSQLQSVAGRRLDSLMQIFIDDQFNSTNDNLSITTGSLNTKYIETLALLVRQVPDNDNDILKDIKESNLKLLELFQKLVLLIQTYNAVNASRKELEVQAAILDDPDALSEYINKHYKNVSILNIDENVNLSESFDLKPEYRLYIERFGYPVGGVFDLDRLSRIISELIADGILEPGNYILDTSDETDINQVIVETNPPPEELDIPIE